MNLHVIGTKDVKELLPMSECIDVMDKAMRISANRETITPLRRKVELPGGKSRLVLMPGANLDSNIFGAKLIGNFEKNFELGLPSHNGVVVLFEGKHGCPFAIVDAAEITAIRTAAASGLATKLLARKNARILAVCGYGTQARQHVEAMLAVRPIKEIRVWGRKIEKSQAFSDEMQSIFKVTITPANTVAEAIEGADIICTTTASPTPILLGKLLTPGQHINAVGTSFPGLRELDTEAIVRSRFFVDLRENTISQAGEFQMARDEGAIDENHIIGEIGDISLQRIKGRLTPQDITTYKSLGLIVQDLAAAFYVYKKAVEKSIGTSVNWSEN